jgi:DNA polymerase III delta prime subunit
MINLNIEQKEIINSIKNGYNIIVDAVAGCGKTTTSLAIAQECKDKKILLLTYNAGLKTETRQRILKYNISNLEVHSYHSFCVKYYNYPCYDDLRMQILLNNNDIINKTNFNFDLIILDEQQDMKPLFFELIHYIIKPNIQICLFGDVNQNIYSYQGSNSDYLIKANELIHSHNEWKKHSIFTTFRVNKSIAGFVNKILLKEDRLNAIKEGPPVQYLICNPFKPKDIINKIKDFLVQGYTPNDIFILAPSIKSKKIPIRLLENILVLNGLPCCVTLNDEGNVIDEEVMHNKILFTTFHQSKGLERKIVFVYSMDEGYYRYAKDAPIDKCPNPIYVACTRSLEHLIIIHAKQNLHLPFLNNNELNNHCIIEGEIAPVETKTDSPTNENIIHNITVTDYLKNLSINQIINILKYIKYDTIQEKYKNITIPTKTLTHNNMYEDVAAINGIAIPSYYEFITNKNSKLLDNIRCNIDDLSIDIKNKLDFILSKECLNINDFLFFATIYDMRLNGYYYKLSQIKTYDWLDEKILKNILNIIHKALGNKIYHREFEEKSSIAINNKKIFGIIDCVDNETKTIWEFKAVSYISEVHLLQLALYALMCKDIYKNYSYKILNILTGEIKELDIINSNLDIILENFK